MKNLFLFLTVTILFLFLKVVQTEKKVSIVRLDVEYSHTIDFTGKLFLPKTLQYGAAPVNTKVKGIIELKIDGKIYTYEQMEMREYYNKRGYLINRYYLQPENSDDEIEVEPKMKIYTNFDKSNLPNSQPVKIFGKKEI